MKTMKSNHPTHTAQGFTLVEVVGAMFLLLLAISLALFGYVGTLRKASDLDHQAELDMDVKMAIESLKNDLRLSSMDYVFFYPATPPYEALSFPIAYPDSTTGMLPRDPTTKRIIWSDTIIYHIRDSTPHQLVRTVFSPRNNALTDEQIQAQLDSVVANGGDNNASSRVIFNNLLHWQLDPRRGQFNGYSLVETLKKNAFIGYVLLDSGDHTFQFEVTEKDTNSTGFAIGIDMLSVTSSSLPLEAEDLEVTQQSSAATAREEMDHTWSGNHQLIFPASQKGASFTVKVNNDRWVETNFPRGIQDDVVVRYDTDLDDIIIRLKGNEIAWKAEDQTGDASPSDPSTNYSGTAVRILLKGDNLPVGGGFITSKGARCRLVFRASETKPFGISNVRFGVASDPESYTMAYLSNSVPVRLINPANNLVYSLQIPAAKTATTEWIDVPITPTNNYLVTYTIDNSTGHDAPRLWADHYGSTYSWPFATKIAFFDTAIAAHTAAEYAASPYDWSDATGINVHSVNFLPGLERVRVSYVEKGTFTSRIADTGMLAPQYNDIDWTATVPTGCNLKFKVRAGNQYNLSDASAWTNLTAFTTPRGNPAPLGKRYIQFQAELESSANHLQSPDLHDVTMDWPGDTRLVNIGGDFTTGPDHGVFEVSVDGEKLQSALVVDLEIYKDVRVGKGNETRRISSSQKVEINPRNTGK